MRYCGLKDGHTERREWKKEQSAEIHRKLMVENKLDRETNVKNRKIKVLKRKRVKKYEECTV